jgi:aspartate kinase
MNKVVKFGGSSLANAEQFKKAGEIIMAEESRRYVVPSAPGKRHSGDTKVTDMLYGCYRLAEDGEDYSNQLKAIKERFYEIIRGLNLELSLEEDFREIDDNFKNLAGQEYAASRGEFLNGKIMAAYLGYTFVDAAEVVRFTADGTLDMDATDVLMVAKLENLPNAVVP